MFIFIRLKPMKLINRTKIQVILIVLAFLISLTSIFFLKIFFSQPIIVRNYRVKQQAENYSILPYKIHINNNWSLTNSTYDWCSGSGTSNNPYVIENVTIDGEGLGSCVLIQNSVDYFRIENCIIYNSGSNSGDAGIKFVNVTYGTLHKNNCSNNNYGISLSSSNQNNLSDNTANDNSVAGIDLSFCDNNIISTNILSFNQVGLSIKGKTNNIIQNIVISNAVRGIDGYDCEDSNFLNNNIYNSNDGIFMEFSNNYYISNNELKYNDNGLYLYGCHNGNVTNNLINENRNYGVQLVGGSTNLISNNELNYNNIGLLLDRSSDNSIIINSINENINNGMNLVHSDSNYISNNDINRNENGLYSQRSNTNNLANNLIKENRNYGIHLHHSNNNSVKSNTIDYNKVGLSIRTSNYNNIFMNNFRYNLKAYEVVFSSVGNVFSDNQIVSYPNFQILLFLIPFLIISLISVGLLVIESKNPKRALRKITESPFKIRGTIIKIGMKKKRIHIEDLRRKCKTTEEEVRNIIDIMISNQEIEANYYNSTKTLVFLRQTISKDIDRLMEMYKEWEKKKIGKENKQS